LGKPEGLAAEGIGKAKVPALRLLMQGRLQKRLVVIQLSLG
jgi:hypothetical protein